MIGAMVVLASHAGEEILGAGPAMAEANARGARIGIIMLSKSPPSGIAPGTGPSTRVRDALDCLAVLQELLGEVPPLLMVPFALYGPYAPDGPDLAEDSLLNSFLHTISAATLVVTECGDSKTSHKAALRLASRIIAQGLAKRLMVIPLSGNARYEVGLDAWGSHRPAADTRDTPPHIIRCQRQDAGAFSPHAAAWWDFTTSSGQAAHFSRIVAALQDRWYPDILELGCANGMLTPVLAAHSNHVVTFDASQAALDGAQMRVGGAFNVELRRGTLPRDLPTGTFDLVLLNDCLRDLGFDAVAELARRLPLLCNEGCRIIVANRLDEAADELAIELLLAELSGWAITHSGQPHQPQIQVLERC